GHLVTLATTVCSAGVRTTSYFLLRRRMWFQFSRSLVTLAPSRSRRFLSAADLAFGTDQTSEPVVSSLSPLALPKSRERRLRTLDCCAGLLVMMTCSLAASVFAAPVCASAGTETMQSASKAAPAIAGALGLFPARLGIMPQRNLA